MAFLTSKWIIILVITLLIILSFTFKKTVKSEIYINATKQTVWNVITNTNDYEKWNSVLTLVDGNLGERQKVKYNFTQEEGKQYDVYVVVKKINQDNILNQCGGTKGIITYDHFYLLSEKNKQTKLIIKEDYRGLMVLFWSPNKVQKAYDRLILDIKKQSEHIENNK